MIRNVCWAIGWTGARLFLLLFYKVRRSGRENLPRTGAVLYLANHQSHLDPPIISAGLGLRRQYVSMARSTLFDNAILGPIIRSLQAVPVQQGRADTTAIKALLAALHAGRSVLVFPEGSRTPDGRTQRLQRGMVLLLKRSGVPVVPIAIEGAHDIWPKSSRSPRLSGLIRVHIAPPIDPDELLSGGPDEALERLRRELETHRMVLRRQLRDQSNDRYPAPGPADRPYWEEDSAV